MTPLLSLAWRNLWRVPRRTLISMSAIGVGLLLVVFYAGMVGGLLGDAKNQLDDGGLGHLELSAKGWRAQRAPGVVLEAPDALRAGLQLPPGSEVGSRVLARGLATSARGSEPVQLFGVGWGEEAQLSSHLRQVRQGALPAEDDVHGVLVGEELAQRLHLKLGGKLRLMVARVDGEMGADLFRVRGIFHSVAPAIGQRQVYVSQGAARELLGLERGVHQIVVQLPEPDRADALAAASRPALGDGVEVLTWGELLPVLRRMEALTNTIVLALAGFVYLLVGLGVLNTMLMSVLERTRELGVLMALGTRPRRIVGMVLAESFWVATLSVAVGALIGGLLTWHFSRTGIRLGTGGEAMQLEGATLSTLVKTRFEPLAIARASGLVFLMALVVGLYPASRITRLQPAEALRRT